MKMHAQKSESEIKELTIIGGLANLLANQSDHTQTIIAVVEYVKEALNADRVCATVFSTETGTRAFGNKNELCRDCEDSGDIVKIAERVANVSKLPLMGEALLALLTDHEKDRLQLHYPLYFPISFDERFLGALWCDGADFNKKSAAGKKGMLGMMHTLVSLAFRNVLFYELQISHESALMQILDNLDANIYVSDLYNDDVLFINKKMAEEYGLDRNVVGEKCWKVLQEGMTERCSFCPSHELVKDPSQSLVWEEHSTATQRYYKNTDSVIEWLDGRLVHLQHSVNITTEKEVMHNLEEAKLQAELANSAKSDFLSRMSHEIRTPINAIIGMSRIAGSSPDLVKAQDCIRKIDSSSKQLLSIVNDILDMSKIEANKMELAHERFDFEKMLIDVSNIVSTRAEEKQQKLHIHMDMSMSRFFKGDEMRLSQVITNLLTNAVKFTPEFGTISMSVQEKLALDGRSRIEVKISDTGIGISKAQQSMLFKAFEQADGGIARRFGGTGLGLAIAKSIVQIMDGDISVESTEGEGSVFTFDIMLERAEPGEVDTEYFKDVDISGIRILLLDEDEKIRTYFSEIMGSLNINAKTVSNIDECFQMLAETKHKGECFDIIFLDWEVAPGMGAQLCMEIKRQFGSSIIVLTSLAQWSEIRTEAENYGISHYLSKPLFPSTIINVINEVIGLPTTKSEMAQINRYRFTGYHLLLVEDVEINREIVCMALEDTKIKISSAPNGQVALSMVEENPTAYDLILMDVNMPEMDGYEATRRIRVLPNEWAKKIPILAMTANAFADDIRKSLDSGMNDHITKPLNFDALFSKLHHYFTQYPRPVSTDNMDSHNPTKAVEPYKTVDTQGLVNLEEALKRLNGNTRVYKTILSSFIRHSGFDDLTGHFEKKDIKATKDAIHAIKGVSGNLSLTAVYKDMVYLEESVKSEVFDMGFYRTCLDNFEKTKQVITLLLEKM